jgi:hypothetical protein
MIKKKTSKPVFDIDLIRADWQALADQHAGTQEAVRFLTLLAGVKDWDGACPTPITVNMKHD